MLALAAVDDVLRALHTAEPGKTPWQDVHARLERARADADAAFLAGLLDAGEPPLAGGGASFSPGSSLAETALRALALIPEPAAVAALIARVRWTTLPTQLAAALAKAQPLSHLVQAVRAPTTDAAAVSLLAAWMHERVYHDAAGLAHPVFAAFAGRLREEGHPLARVPLTLTSLEAGTTRRPLLIGMNVFSSWSLSGPAESPLDPRGACDLRATAHDEWSWAARVREIFCPAGEVTNARVEAIRYLLDAPVDVDLLGAPLLRALAPDCMTGRRDDDEDGRADEPAPDLTAVTVHARRVEPAEALGWFLHLAIGWRCYGAYGGVGPGRARAYAGLGALCGASPDTPWSDIDRAARERHFALFNADTRWFDRVCEDFGCLVLDPSRDVVTVVAETDSD